MRARTASAVLLIGLAAAATGRVDAQESEPERPVADEEIDTIIVRGRRSRGMAAFEAGDFVTAEIEFARNARCALRRERNRAAGIDQIQQNQIGQEASPPPTVQGSPTGPNSAPPPPTPAQTQGFRAPAQAQGEGTDDSLDCGNRGFQVYMKGLSQLQLGKIEEAEESFRQAGNLNKNLYDAQYRLGLIAVLRGDEKEARWRLKAIKRILKRCRDCDVREEILARRDHLEAALRGDVALGPE